MDNSPFKNKILKTNTNPKKDLNSLHLNINNNYTELSNSLIPNENYNSLSNIKKQDKEPIKKTEILKTITEDTNQYIEEMKKGSYNILVAVRCRPLSQKEREISVYETIQIMQRKIIILKDPNGYLNPNNIRTKEQTLAFDYAFDQFESQKDIFNNTTKFLIDGVTNGFNATVFAYGATGAGKTYTMTGTEENPGIMSLTLNELFEKIKSYPEREYTIKLWYLEIYNENIRDLLINNSENLELREDPNKGLIVNGITEITPKSSEHILNILKKGNKNRTTESTNANETSSRSHAILQIMVSYKNKTTGVNYEIKYGKLNLIDLAGSERASMTKNKGMRLFEGANINKSLLTLGNCINALCEANEKGVKTYIPYRDSKLTRLLKDSLGGNARTVMIANVSPFVNSFDDTYNTLKYADRAKHIKTNIKRNVLNAQYHITNYLNIIKNLQNKIFELENQISISKRRDLTTSPINKISTEINENEFINNINNKKILKMSNLIKNRNINIKKENEKNNKNMNLFIYNENYKTNSEEKDYKQKEHNKFFFIIKEYTSKINKEIKLKEKIINIQQEIFSLKNENSNSQSKIKLNDLKNKLEECLDSYKDISNKNENEYNLLLNDESLEEINKSQLQILYENRRISLELNDMKLKLFKSKIIINNSKLYIRNLEEQIELRDVIILKNNEIFYKNDKETFLNVLNSEQKSKYKNLNEILNKSLEKKDIKKQNDYSTKLKKRNENLNIDIKESQLFSKSNTQKQKYSPKSLNLNPSFSESNDFLQLKKEKEISKQNSELYLPYLPSKINQTCSKENHDENIYNSSIKSMLNSIKEINSDISFKFNIIEQKKKNKNNHNNPSQETTDNNIKNSVTCYDIPNNNNYKTKNLIQKLFQKESEKMTKQNSSFKGNNKNNKLSSTAKKFKNSSSNCNIKTIKKNISNKANLINTPLIMKNIKNNKIESRTKSALTRIVKNLPKSAKSSTNEKNNKINKNDNKINKETEFYNTNDNQKRINKLEEIFNKAREDIINKRKNKFQNNDIEFINNFNKIPNSLGNEKIIDNYFTEKKIFRKNQETTNMKNNNKQISPYYKTYKIKSKLTKVKSFYS